MSQLSLIAKCRNCEENQAQTSPDKNNPFFNGDEEFGLVIEWLNKQEILKKVSETKCPTCGSEDWYLTDSAEH